MDSFKEGDIVRVRSMKNPFWAGTWRVSSVMDKPPLAYIRNLEGNGKGYIELKHIELIGSNSESELNKQMTLF